MQGLHDASSGDGIGPCRNGTRREGDLVAESLGVKDTGFVAGGVERDLFTVDDQRVFNPGDEQEATDRCGAGDHQQPVILARRETRMGPVGVAAPAVGDDPFPAGEGEKPAAITETKRRHETFSPVALRQGCVAS
jgi:hypothetical protein